MKNKKLSQKDVSKPVNADFDDAPRQFDLSSYESVEFILAQIEKYYIVAENQKQALLKLIEEYFWLKDNAAPTSIKEKWTEIDAMLETLERKSSH